MSYIDTTKAQQIIGIAKDYLGTQYYSLLSSENNGFKKPKEWDELLCFYELYRLAKHRTTDLINDTSYQTIIQFLLSKVSLTPNYSLATCNSNVIIANGGCGCNGGTTTTGTVAGCRDIVWAFHMNQGEAIYINPVLHGLNISLALRNGIGMSLYVNDIQGFVFNSVAGSFTPNSPVSEQGEDFVLLLQDCNVNGGIIPPGNLPDPIEFVVGITPGSPVAGTTIYTNIVLANRLINLYRQGAIQTLVGYAGGEGYTNPNISGAISISPAWVDGETVKIEVYK